MIMLEFNYGANLDAKTNDIRDRIDRVRRQLPDEADTPSIMQFDPNSMPILRVAVKGSRTQNELRAVAVNTIQDRLEQVDGVASTSVMGGQEQLVRVGIAQNRLEAYGLTITGIAGTLAAQKLNWAPVPLLKVQKITASGLPASIRAWLILPRPLSRNETTRTLGFWI